jgi:type I restriction enzyme S subunit
MIKVILKDIVEKPITGEWGNEGNSVNVLRTTNFTNEGFINFTKVVKRDVEQKKIDLKRLARGDIIIEKSGGSPTQPVGRVVYFDSEEIFLCNNFTAILRPKKEQVFPKYLHYLLFVGHQFGLTSAFQNKTTGIINLQLTKYLEGIKIPLPPLPQQQKIASILDAADALRQKDKTLLAKYDELTQSLFLDMFGDPVSNPKGWENLKLGLLTNMKAGKFISASEILSENNNDLFSCYGGNGLRGFVKSHTHEGDFVLIGRQGALCGNVKVTDGKFHATEHAIVCSPKMQYQTLWLYYLLKMMNLNRFATGAAQPGLNVGTLVDLEIISTPISLQNQFAERIQNIEHQKAIAQKSLEKSETLFNSLLQKAFKGGLV